MYDLINTTHSLFINYYSWWSEWSNSGTMPDINTGLQVGIPWGEQQEQPTA